MLFLRKFFLNKYGFLSIVFVTIAFFTIFTLLYLLDSYQYSLKKELLSKQAHIYIKYTNNKHIDKNLIREVNKILGNDKTVLVPYIKGKKYIHIEAGDSFAGTSLQASAYIYGFLQYNTFFKNKKFNAYSDIGYNIHKLKQFFVDDGNIVILNQTLNSMFNRQNISIVQATIFTKKSKINRAMLLGYFNDYSTKPVLYTNLKFAKKILQDNSLDISGYMIKIKDVSKIDGYIKLIRDRLKDKNLIVTQTTQTNGLQIKILTSLKNFIYLSICIVFCLAVFVNIMLLYGIMLDKQPQIRILFNLGIDISSKIIIATASIFSLFAFIGFYCSKLIFYIFLSKFSIANVFPIHSKLNLFFILLVIFLSVYVILVRYVFLIRNRIK